MIHSWPMKVLSVCLVIYCIWRFIRSCREYRRCTREYWDSIDECYADFPPEDDDAEIY